MINTSKGFILIVFLIVIAGPGQAQKPPGMSWSQHNLDFSYGECMKRVSEALRNEQFKKIEEHGRFWFASENPNIPVSMSVSCYNLGNNKTLVSIVAAHPKGGGDATEIRKSVERRIFNAGKTDRLSDSFIVLPNHQHNYSRRPPGYDYKSLKRGLTLDECKQACINYVDSEGWACKAFTYYAGKKSSCTLLKLDRDDGLVLKQTKKPYSYYERKK